MSSLVPYSEVIQSGGFDIDSEYLPAFSGRRIQRGSGGVSGVLKGFFKTLAPYAKSAATSIGKNASSAGLESLDMHYKTKISNNLLNAIWQLQD